MAYLSKRYPSIRSGEQRRADFMAEMEPVSLQAKFTGQRLALTTSMLEPFVANRESEVPLWVGFDLQYRGIGVINPPEWMQMERLQAIYDAEVPEAGQEQLEVKMEKYAFEVGERLANLHSSAAGRSAGSGGGVLALSRKLDDIKTRRVQKLRKGLVEASHMGGVLETPANLVSREASLVRARLRPILEANTIFENIKEDRGGGSQAYQHRFTDSALLDSQSGTQRGGRPAGGEGEDPRSDGPQPPPQPAFEDLPDDDPLEEA